MIVAIVNMVYFVELRLTRSRDRVLQRDFTHSCWSVLSVKLSGNTAQVSFAVRTVQSTGRLNKLE